MRLHAATDAERCCRESIGNRWLWLSIACALGLQALVLYVPALQKAFNTVPLGAADWLLCTLVASTVVIARELLKARWRQVDRRSASPSAA